MCILWRDNWCSTIPHGWDEFVAGTEQSEQVENWMVRWDEFVAGTEQPEQFEKWMVC